MAVKIRLRRMGAKKRPFYRLVVADARSPRDGRFIEAVGTYDPLQTPAVVRIDAERVKEWMGKGARPTDTARQLLVSEGLLERTAKEYPQAERKPKLNKKAIARAAAEAAAPPPSEAPAAEEAEAVADTA
ncbi:MAG: 30S ribosomal protein S16, partial [Candidatus Dormiibacterota bacterium]